MELTLEEWILVYSAWALIVVALFAASYTGLKYRKLAVTEQRLEEALDNKMLEVYTQDVPKKRNYYNVRCHCGRFAKRVLGTESVTDCHKHGVEVNWRMVNVDWIYKPVSPTEVGIEVEVVHTLDEVEQLTLTQPLDIIIPDYVDNIQWRPSTNIRKQIQLIPQ